MTQQEEATRQSRSLTSGELAIPFAIYLALFTLTLSRVPSITADSIGYINLIDSRSRWFHPHHLLYGPLACAWVAIWKSLGAHIDSQLLVSELSAIFGALSVCVIYSILRCRLEFDSWTATLATALPAFSWGLWYYSGCVDVYVIALFFLLLCLLLLTAEHVDEKIFAFVGFLNGIAVVLAEMSVLFAPAVFLAAWYSHQSGDIRLTKSVRSYISAVAPTVAIPYLWVLFSLGRATSAKSAWIWLTEYAHQSRFWSPLSTTSLFKAGIGLGQAFIGSHFVFALPLVRSWVELKLPEFYLIHDAYLVRTLGETVARILFALSVALCLMLLLLASFNIRRWRTLSAPKKQLLHLVLVWLLCYGAFILFYTPINAKYWIAPSMCLWMIFVALWLDGTNREPQYSSKVALAILVTLMFVVNFMGSIRFTRDLDNDYYYAQAQALLRLSAPGDLVVIGRSWKLEEYLVRYGNVRVMSLTSIYEMSNASPESVRHAESAIEDELARGGEVVISQEAVVFAEATVRRYPGITVFQALWDRYRRRWITKQFQATIAYVLEPMNVSSIDPPHKTYAAAGGN